MKHDPYSLTELIRNDEFIAWVLHPDALSDLRWNTFLENYPEKKDTVESAREYVILLAKDTGKHKPTPKQADKMWKVVESRMHAQEPVVVKFEPAPSSGWRWVRVAASAALILSIGSVSYWFYYKQANAQEMAFSEQEHVPGVIQRHNDTSQPMTVLLPDGSSVVLQPGGYLSYAEKPEQNRREVTLTGRAFFEVVKNKQKPFLVYSYGLATKVLGTSFLVDAPENSGEIKVEVKTGTVEVFSVQDLSAERRENYISQPSLQGVKLEHDQRIAFSRDNGKISKLAERAPLVASAQDISKLQFVFDETPVSKVFESLEMAYNVQIRYDIDKMSTCPLNATLVGQPLKEKLEVICNALNAQFTIHDDIVTVTGKGCR